jgi:hypothetical protein
LVGSTILGFAKSIMTNTLGDDFFFICHIVLGVDKLHQIANKKCQNCWRCWPRYAQSMHETTYCYACVCRIVSRSIVRSTIIDGGAAGRPGNVAFVGSSTYMHACDMRDDDTATVDTPTQRAQGTDNAPRAPNCAAHLHAVAWGPFAGRPVPVHQCVRPN